MRTLSFALLILCAPLVSVSLPRPARAENVSRDAGKHFQRGVDLYSDGDFRGALVEFKKAYSLWPRANVLYDIAQTEYQLLDYAAALRTMERYLSETGANAPHRQEVEASVEVLRQRVGRILLTTESACDVTVDDQPAGTSPLDAPVLVSVGSRKLTVSCSGQRTVSRRVDVVAGETARVEVYPPPPPIGAVRAGMTGTPAERRHASAQKSFVTGWIVSGVLVAATIAMGTATLVEQSQLSAMRDRYPLSKSDLDRQTAMTTGLAITSDILGATSVVAVGVSTYLTIKYERERGKHLRLGLSAGGVQVGGTF
jgi:hypothetical protein